MNLPPLPPVGGGTSGRSVLDVLREQHRELLALCDRAGDDRRAADVLVAVLSRHLSAEEQYLYPAIRRAVPGGEELAARELAEDKRLLIMLKSGRIGHDEIRRHVRADEDELFGLLAEMVSMEDLIRLGNRVETAEEAAPTRPHPGTPSTPPWNKVVDPAVAVVDKLRDLVTGRTTYYSDL